MPNAKRITFLQACELLRKAPLITLDGHAYDLKVRPEGPHGMLALQRRVEPDPANNPLVVWFSGVDHADVPLDGTTLHMREEHGEDAEIVLPECVLEGGYSYSEAEIAAALMSEIHTDVTQQDEGSYSAYEELREVIRDHKLEKRLIWQWMAIMAAASNVPMSTRWKLGMFPLEELAQPVAQEFHNFITDPRNFPVNDHTLTTAKAEAMWEAAVVTAKEYAEQIARTPSRK